MTLGSTPDDEHLRERLERRTPVFAGRLLQVFDDEVVLADGRPARREIVLHPGAAAIVAVTDDGRIVLVRQWRHAVGGPVWEIPAGTCAPREPASGTAMRELTEETGYRAARWSGLGAAWVSPGYARELISFFLAEGLTAGDPSRDPDERLDVRVSDMSEILGLVAAGEVDCKTIAGLALAGLLPAATPRPL